MSDVGLTHVAFAVEDLERSLAFYAKYARMAVVHRRADPQTGSEVAWITDKTRPFVLVLIQGPQTIPRSLQRIAGKMVPYFSHLGVACGSRDEVDRLAAEARADGCLRLGPQDYGPPVGYFAFFTDPDGHTLEVSYGQDVGLAVEHARGADAASDDPVS
jgi:catechol 2,3-dioxygenase-like lactoylglutathione lyase family enzyme